MDRPRKNIVSGSTGQVTQQHCPAAKFSQHSFAASVNMGLEDEMKIVGYRTERPRQVMTWTFIVLTIGLLRLVFYWRPDWMVKSMCRMVHLDLAEYIILQDQYDQIFVEKVKLMTVDNSVAMVKSSSSSSAWSKSRSSHSEIMLRVPSCDEDSSSRRYFINKKIKYVWNSESQQFEKLRGLEEGMECSHFHEMKGLTESDASLRRNLYGSNSIVIHVTPIIKLLFTQALHPFYIFQLFSCILWYTDHYGYYATCILLISAISLTAQIYETRSMQRALKSTLSPTEVVSVYRSDKDAFEMIPSDLLVPGDIIEVPRQGCVMQSDAILINGNCIVNESMLTGESIPVTKTPIASGGAHPGVNPGVPFNITEHSRHVLFCGTHVIQTRYYGSHLVRAVVIRTGFSTAKGELVRSILYPKPVDFKFTQDGVKYIGVLALISVGGMIYTFVLMIQRGDDAGMIVTRALDLITIVIPPALPAAMTIGIVFAQKRLKRRKVFCISPRSINLCGAINVFCFDKTGTLTEDGLDLYGVVPACKQVFQSEERLISALDQRNPVVVAMATCHSLTIIEGRISGDPLDQKMFEATNWELEEPGEDTNKYDIIMPTVVHPKCPDIVTSGQLSDGSYDNSDVMPYEIGILRQFTFSSKLQRMSVISRELKGDHFDVYTKGSPEMIVSLCNAQTVPDDFHDLLTYYTQQGYRVIALAHKQLSRMTYVKIHRAQRDQLERDLTFLGLLVMENRLKPETQPIIQTLKGANIRTVMVTGDNMLTALSVARDCQLIDRQDQVVMVTALPPSESSGARLEYTHSEDHRRTKSLSSSVGLDYCNSTKFTISGKSWTIVRKYFPDILPKLAVRGIVFSRFSPENKQQLIELLQDTGYYVGMCGDGANDCGALKTAHAGISLSEAEASVASPFTSKEPNISCVPNVIREGRAALVTSYGIFRFMACYSMTQFLSICLLYWIGANLTDFTFLYIDLLLLTSLGITFCYTGPYPVLDPKPPRVSLIAVTPVLSLVLQLLINFVVQMIVWTYTAKQPWFESFNGNEDYLCYEVTVVFLSSSFQYIIMAVVFAKGPPYRKAIYTNYVFMCNIIICTVITLFVVLYPFQWVIDLMTLQMPPSVAFRALIVGLAVINFFIGFIVETYLVDFLIDGRCLQPLTNKYINSKLPYNVVETEMRDQPNWPPISASGATVAELMRLEHLAGTDAADDGTESKPLVDEDSEEDEKLSRCSSTLRYDVPKVSKDVEAVEGSKGIVNNAWHQFEGNSSSTFSPTQVGKEDFIPVLSKTREGDARLTMIVPNGDLTSIEFNDPSEKKTVEMTIL